MGHGDGILVGVVSWAWCPEGVMVVVEGACVTRSSGLALRCIRCRLCLCRSTTEAARRIRWARGQPVRCEGAQVLGGHLSRDQSMFAEPVSSRVAGQSSRNSELTQQLCIFIAAIGFVDLVAERGVREHGLEVGRGSLNNAEVAFSVTYSSDLGTRMGQRGAHADAMELYFVVSGGSGSRCSPKCGPSDLGPFCPPPSSILRGSSI